MSLCVGVFISTLSCSFLEDAGVGRVGAVEGRQVHTLSSP